MDPSILLEAFVHSGWGARGAMLFTVVFCCGILMIFPILLVLKVDNSILWGWPAVFAPLFVCSGISVCCGCLAAMQAEPPSEVTTTHTHKIKSIYDRITTVAGPALILVFLAVLAVYLNKDEGVTKSFVVVCIPAFLNEAIAVLRMPRELSPSNYQDLSMFFPDTYYMYARICSICHMWILCTSNEISPRNEVHMICARLSIYIYVSIYIYIYIYVNKSKKIIYIHIYIHI